MPLVKLGEYPLRGFGDPMEVFAFADEGESRSSA